MKFFLIFLIVVCCVSGCNKRTRGQEKADLLISQPDKKYCTGEYHGKYREVKNKEVVPYILERHRFPQLCRDFFSWEDERKLNAPVGVSGTSENILD